MLTLALGCSAPQPVAKPSQTADSPVAPVTSTPSVLNKPSSNRLYKLTELGKTQLTVGKQRITAWVADDDLKRSEGMMWLSDADVKLDEGMLFVFPSAEERGFWMANTLIPLDIVYLDERGVVLNIAHGKPEDETTLPSVGKAKFVLELKAGRAADLGLRAGSKIVVPAGVEPKLG